jgi:excisionase family DNA binding protein
MSADENHTVEGFRRLPMLVSLGVFCEWSGLNRNLVGRLVRDGKLRSVQPNGGKRRFYKTDLARLCGLQS